MLGVMLDCSRNAVMNVKSIKRFIDLLAKMGYDTLMLYTEDTYELNHQPFFGYKRGRYTKQELKEIDTYCVSKGVELVPCIFRTFGPSYCRKREQILFRNATKTK